jgi:hypothetical protein
VATPTYADYVIFSSPDAQTIVVGGVTVVAAAGTRRGVLLQQYRPLSIPGPVNLGDIYVDATANNQIVSYLYKEKTT